MSTITEQWTESQQENGFGSPTTWRLSQIIRAQKEEHEAFHAMMKLIPQGVRDEAIALWVKGTENASTEAYNRRLLMSELSEAEYKETQNIAHEAWKKLIGVKS